MMKLTWDYPVYAATEGPRSDKTEVKALRSALPREEALKYIAGNDPRPLLVVRECNECNKTDDALLTPGTDNEKTLIYSRWFHCVKLPVDVSKEDHPFHSLFPLADAEHLFVSLPDGSFRAALESDTSRTELHNSMNRVLSEAYASSPTDALKGIQTHMDRIDAQHQKIAELEIKVGELMERPSVDKAKVKAVQDDIAESKGLIEAERAAIEKLSRLEMRPAAAPKQAAVPAGPAKAGN
jgi:hypothetical protein